MQVNDDGPGDQFSPTVAIAPQGNRAMFGYYSRSHDPANQLFHRRGRMAVISLTSGNVGMRRSFQLGPDTPVAAAEPPPTDPDDTGDYDQIAASASTFFSTWSDNRDGSSFRPAGQPDVFMARINRNAPVTATDLSVGVTPVPATIHEGEQTTLELSATATGNPADDVYVSLAPTNGLAYQSVSGPGCKLIGGLVSCSLGSIAAGTTVQRDVTALGVTRGRRVARAKATTSDKDTDQANNSGSGTVTVKAPPPPPGVTETFSTGNLAVPINDQSVVEVPLPIGVNKTILDLDALVRLNHTYDSDLSMYLLPPAGDTAIPLALNNGDDGDDYGSGADDCAGTQTRFDDDAATSIIDGLPPFAGSFRPLEPLASRTEARPRARGSCGCPTISLTTSASSAASGSGSGTPECLESGVSRRKAPFHAGLRYLGHPLPPQQVEGPQGRLGTR